jgi:hypothetical protein
MRCGRQGCTRRISAGSITTSKPGLFAHVADGWVWKSIGAGAITAAAAA